jgi:ankyrin repeat protein
MTPKMEHERMNGHHVRTALISLACAALTMASGCSGSGGSLYDLASNGGSRSKAVRLVEAGANVNEANPGNGWTPLHAAAANGHTRMVETLIEQGADINAQDLAGSTPLHLAAARGHTDTISILLGYGADASIKNTRGQTADDVMRIRR